MENNVLSGFGDRIKLIRTKNNLTQEEFGKRIGSARNTISNYECENRTPGNSVIALVCREFGINELWLRTGEGDMKNALIGEDRFALNIAKLQNTDNETLMRCVKEIAETNPELLKNIETFFLTLLNTKKELD